MARELIEQIATALNVVTFFYTATNIPDAAGTAIAIEASSNEYIMPWEGAVIGIGVVSNTDLTGGTLTFNPTLAGTADTSLGATLSDTVQYTTAKAESDAVPFAAGARLGVKWTKTGTVAPLTCDVTIVLYVLLKGMTF